MLYIINILYNNTPFETNIVCKFVAAMSSF